jgi:HSP20 family protein
MGYAVDPYREMEEINNRFNQMIRSFFGDTTGMARAGGWTTVTLPVDVEETDDAYVIDIDLPNVNPHDVNIEIRGEELRISGEFQQPERSGVVRQQNRRAGEFEYMVDLPSDIDQDRIDATYHNGVLRVMVGKAQDSQPRRIEVREVQDMQQLGRDNQMQARSGGGQQSAAQQSAMS